MAGSKKSPRANRGPTAGPENRAALVAAAREVFATRGFDAPMSAVAKLAGVGQGSLYRHFPDRLDLAVAVFEENTQAIEALAGDDVATLDDVAAAITVRTEGIAAFLDAIARGGEHAEIAGMERRVRAVVESKWAAAQRDGIVGPSASVDDFMLAVAMVAGVISAAAPGERHASADAAWALLRRGLKG